MNPVFTDTSYFLAFFGETDEYHDRAVAWTRSLRTPVLTTEYVVIELGNSLTRGSDRAVFVDFYNGLEATKIEVVPTSKGLQDKGAKLFADRVDKEWSLTDCISFVIMSERGMHQALTADRDFEQAAFRALLRYDPP